jgi:hypothetical protein
MRRDNGASIDQSGNLVDGETATVPLHNLRQIGRGWLQRRGRGAIATTVQTMAGATVLYKHGRCPFPCGVRACRGSLLRCQGHAQKGAAHDHTETIPLHTFSPVRIGLFLGFSRLLL